MFSGNKSKKNGFTLSESLISIFIFTVIFAGIFGFFYLTSKIIILAKIRIIAENIAAGEMEKTRNLPYPSIGLQKPGAFPYGVLLPTSSKILNDIDFLIERKVDFVIDPLDGTQWPQDECPFDYKKVVITVSWQKNFPGSVSLESVFSPANSIEECQTSGGILAVYVFDARGEMISQPVIQIKDPQTNEVLKTASPDDGYFRFSMSPGTYRIDVSKAGYSFERTYGIDEITYPKLPHQNVLEKKVTEVALSIDKLSQLEVLTLSDQGEEFFYDAFLNDQKISSSSNIEILEGKAYLSSTTDEGFLISKEISATDILSWDQLVFSDFKPLGTTIKYQFYFFDATTGEWQLIPDQDLSGNEAGFESSPVNLSSLKTDYSKLKLKISFSSLTTTIPYVDYWETSWKTKKETPLGNISFSFHGEKTLDQEGSIFKFSTTSVSDEQGRKIFPSLEWDLYHFSSENPLELYKTEPGQPLSLEPGESETIKLFFRSSNSLFITVKDEETLDPIFWVKTVLKSNSLGYENTLFTDSRGQVLFISLESVNYSLELSAPGYATKTIPVFVSGNIFLSVKLKALE